MTPSLATQEKGVNGYDRKIIELISGKLGGETPNKSRQHFLFLVCISWLLLRKSLNIKFGKLLFINQTK